MFEFDGLLRSVVHRFKYNGDVTLTRFLAQMIYSQRVMDKRDQEYQCIVPVPLHWLKKISRGYNQAELLALELSKLTGIPCHTMLTRKKWTRPQARLDRRRRRRNLKNAFTLKRSARKIPRTPLLLVDDVFTTGSTLEECTKVLLSTGVESIDVLTLAKG